MRQRWLTGLVLVCAFTLSVPAHAQTKPTLFVRLASIDSLVEDAKYLAALADQEELVKQATGFLKSLGGDKGIAGIDPAKPIAIYGNIGSQGLDSTAVVMVPVVDEKSVLDLLKNMNHPAEKGKDDLYTIKDDNIPFPIYMRFANKYAYVTIRDEAELKPDALLTPDKVFPAGKVGTATVALRIDQIPNELKQLALSQLALRMADIRDQNKTDSKAQAELNKQSVDEISKQIKAVIEDGQEFAFRLDIDRKKHDLSTEVYLTAKSGSHLAETISTMGKVTSVFGGLPEGNSAFRGSLNVSLSDNLRKAMIPVLDEGFAKALANEKDEKKREKAKEFFAVIKPTLTMGQIDAILDLQEPGQTKHHTMLLGLKVKDGKAIEKELKSLMNELPAGDKDRLKVDVDKVGDVNIHRIEVENNLPGQGKDIFGANPLFAAFRDDAVLLSFGDNGLAELKKAVSASKAKGSGLFGLVVNVARMVPAISLDANRYNKEDVAKAATQAFRNSKDNDQISLTVDGGESLAARFAIKAPVLKFFGLLQKAEKKDK